MNTALRQAVILLACTLIAGVGTHFLHPRAPAWFARDEPLAADEVSLEIIRQKWPDGVLWIDARSRKAFDAAHVPGALLLNEQERDALLMEHFTVLQDNQKPIVIYCDGHACQASRKIADHLRERLPDSEVFVLRGGWTVAASLAQP